MESQTQTCQNCKNSFTIEPEDFEFYEKIKVPSPTFCYLCRFQRRLMFRNERVLYKGACALCGKNIITIHDPNKKRVVYCSPCWWSDRWDPLEYGQAYDPSRNFFEQFQELQQKVPLMDLVNSYSTLVNSDYINHAGSSKDCYLIFNSDYTENVLYSTTLAHLKDCADSDMLAESELSYWTINGYKLYRAFFTEDCIDSHNIYFSKALSGCSDCFGCINLRNKKFHIFNKPYSREEYNKKLNEFCLDSYGAVEKLKKETLAFWLTQPHRYVHTRLNVNSSGDYVYECKNSHYMYKSRYVEEGKYSQFMTLAPAKDIYDLSEWGQGVQLVVDSITVGQGANNIRFCFGSWDNVLDNEYSMFSVSSDHVFGCLSIRKKEHCILNKQYSKEEYEILRTQIIMDMNARPYIDSKGRIWKYGEFFPYDVSLFDYNESTAIQYFTVSKTEVVERGWRWRDPDASITHPTVQKEAIPDSINNTPNTIIKEILECNECKKPFRVITQEFELLKRFCLPLPRKCPNCRHIERMARINPPQLWDRKCAKCGIAIQTSYAPERPEIVYCESCYNSEVV